MKLEIERHPGVTDRGAYLGNVATRAAQQLASLMQQVGISQIFLSERRSVLGNSLVMDGPKPVSFFEEVPSELMYYGLSFADGVAKCMEAFGITRLCLVPEEDDLASLKYVWEELAGYRRPELAGAARKVEAPKPEEPAPSDAEAQEVVIPKLVTP